MPPRFGARFRENLTGAALLFLLINLTLFPFLWGAWSLRDNPTVQSLYASGSRSPSAVVQPVYRVFDVGASAWQTEPWFALEHDVIFGERTAPLWNPYSAYGTPLAGNMQSQPFSPFAWIAIASKSPQAFNWFIAARFVTGGIFAMLFLRLFVGFWPALVGGASFMYAGYFWLYVTSPEVSVEVLLPAMLFGAESVLRRRTLTRVAIFSLALTAAVAGGMPESLLLAVVLVYAYVGYRLLGEPALRAGARGSAGAIAAASFLALGMSSVVLAPFFQYLPESFNAHSTNPLLGAGDAWQPTVLATYLSPLMLGPPWNDIFTSFAGFTGVRGFFGTSATFLAAAAVVARVAGSLRREPSTRPVAFFAAVAVLCLAKRFDLAPVKWLGSLPGFRSVILVKYDEAELACAVAVLAGFGAAAIMERRVSPAGIALSAAVPLGALQLCVRALDPQLDALRDHAVYLTYSLAVGLGCLAATAALAYASDALKARGPLVGILLLGSVVVEAHASYIVPMFYHVDPEPRKVDDALAGAPYVRFLQRHSADGMRFLGRNNILFPDWSDAFGLRDVRDIDAMYSSRYLKFIRAFQPSLAAGYQGLSFTGLEPMDLDATLTRRFLDLSSIRYIGVSARRTKTPASSNGGYPIVFREPSVAIVQVPRPLPRLSVYRSVAVAPDDDAALARLTASRFDPWAQAVVQSGAAQTSPGALETLGTALPQPAIPGDLSVDRSRFVEGTVTTPSAGLAVLTDTYFPGWFAWVDGVPATIVRVNYMFRGVLVGPGTHVVTFKYVPPAFAVARYLSLFCLVGVGLMLLADRRRASART